MSQNDSPKPKQALEIAELDARLAAHAERQQQRESPRKPKQDLSSFGAAMRVSADLIGGIVVGVALAWGLAWFWPEARVVLLASGFVFGVGIGLYNAWRAAKAEFGSPRQPSNEK